MKTRILYVTLILLLIESAISVRHPIIDKQDNVDHSLKQGVKQEFRHPTCKVKQHAAGKTLPIRPDGEYDFIIVGGGSAGNLMAYRLIEKNPDISVLVIESGKNLVDDAGVMDQRMKEIFKVPYCQPGQTSEKCPLLSMPTHFAETPFMQPYLTMINESYYFTTIPQVYGNKREINYPRGNLLGGSSATNNMVPFRGHPEDFDQWASLGLEGWSWKEVLPFFKKFEANVEFGDRDYHGKDGIIHVTNVSSHFRFPVADELLKAAWKMGYPKVEDPNHPVDNYGAGYWQQFTNTKGRRTSSYEFLRKAMGEGRVCLDGYIAVWQDEDELKIPVNDDSKKESKQKCTRDQNLHVWTDKFVTKLLVDDKMTDASEKKRVIGVELVDHDKHPYEAVRMYPNAEGMSEGDKSRRGLEYWKTDQRHEVMNCPVAESLAWDNDRMNEWYIPPYHYPHEYYNLYHHDPETNLPDISRVYAKREVILTAGAINSPQLMMLSGIGPRSHLEHQLGMKSHEIVMDLPGVGSRVLDHEEITVNFKLPSGKRHWNVVTDLLGHANNWLQGKPSALAANHIPAGMDISSEGPKGKKPTIHMHFLMLYFENLDHNMWKNQDAGKRVPRGLTDFARYEGLDHYTILIERCGTCSQGSLRLRNRNPFLTPFLDMGYGSCQFTNEELMFGIKEARKLNEMLPEEWRGTEVMPGKEYDTDDKLLNWIRNMVWGHHVSGSLPMGTCDDEMAVLDNHGRVFGVEGLRVADASVFPIIPHGNILMSTYMVAERIADFTLKDHGLATTESK